MVKSLLETQCRLTTRCACAGYMIIEHLTFPFVKKLSEEALIIIHYTGCRGEAQ